MQIFMQVLVKLLLVLSTVAIMQGCNSTGEKPQKVEQKPAPKEVVVAEPGLTPKQRFAKALGYLEIGESDRALAELTAHKKAFPKNRSVSKLIKQINTPSSQYYPGDFYTVELRSGQSLSTLSKKYLGSALDFYSLAKYNNVKNARKVLIGQKIKIPKTQLARTVWEKEQSDMQAGNVDESVAETSVESVTDIETTTISDEEASLVGISDELQDELTSDDTGTEEPLILPEPIDEVTAESLLEEIETLNLVRDFESAVAQIEALKSIGSISSSAEPAIMESFIGYAEQIKDTDYVAASDYYLMASEMHAQRGSEVESYVYLEKASEVNSEDSALAEKANMLKQQLVDKYHRQASSEFRRQELDPAIANWDTVLVIDPSHDNAKVFRARAIELKERLRIIEKN